MKTIKEDQINILERMLIRMEEGSLGCSGFTIIETNALRFAIKELKLLIT